MTKPAKKTWTALEDSLLCSAVECHGEKGWATIAQALPGRIGKQCRDRWFNHLRPKLKKGDWTPQEDDILFAAQQRYGNAWSKIANELLPGRTDLSVKNRFYSFMRKVSRRNKRKAEQSLEVTTSTATTYDSSSTSTDSSSRGSYASSEAGGRCALKKQKLVSCVPACKTNRSAIGSSSSSLSSQPTAERHGETLCQLVSALQNMQPKRCQEVEEEHNALLPQLHRAMASVSMAAGFDPMHHPLKYANNMGSFGMFDNVGHLFGTTNNWLNNVVNYNINMDVSFMNNLMCNAYSGMR